MVDTYSLDQAREFPCVFPQRTFCIASQCPAWRWKDRDSRESTSITRIVRLSQSEMPEFEGRYFSARGDERERQVRESLDAWNPPCDVPWRVRNKSLVNLGSTGGFHFQATLERDRWPGERYGYCGVGGVP